MTVSKQKDSLRPILSLCVLKKGYAENQSWEMDFDFSCSSGGGEKREDLLPVYPPSWEF